MKNMRTHLSQVLKTWIVSVSFTSLYEVHVSKELHQTIYTKRIIVTGTRQGISM